MNKFLYTIAFAAIIPLQSMALTTDGKDSDDTRVDLTTQAISTVNAQVLSKNSTLFTADVLYGLFPGLTMKQNTGWLDSATAVIRGGGSINGVTPLVLVDGVARSMDYVNIQEIETVSVLKDAAATAIYGTQGANGVILITTKRGIAESFNIEVDYTFGVGLPVNMPQMASAYDYATAVNQARDNDGLTAIYDDVDSFITGLNNDLYPNSDWQGEALGSATFNHQFNLAMRGGSKRMKYYSAIDYSRDKGILNDEWTTYTGRYDSQILKTTLSGRVNLDIEATKTTFIKVNLLGLLDEDKMPYTDLSTVFSDIITTPSAVFPVKTASGYWGGSQTYGTNPIANIADSGYAQYNERGLFADFTLDQRLDVFLPGLGFEGFISYDNTATMLEEGDKNYQYEENFYVYNASIGQYEQKSTVIGEDEALEVNNDEIYYQYIRSLIKTKLYYNKIYGKSSFNANLQYQQESYITSGQNESIKRQATMFFGNYNYDNKYIVDVVANRAGVSYLSEGSRFATYPAVSAAWVISNEGFMNSSKINFLKLRASYGQVGYEGGLDYDLDRQFYDGSGGSYSFTSSDTNYWGLREGVAAIDNLACEVATKINIGIDMSAFNNHLTMSLDIYDDHRTDSLVDGDNMTAGVYGLDASMLMIGESRTKGVELSAMWNSNIGKNFSYYIGGNVSYLDNQILENGEGYLPYSYQSGKGLPYGQVWGYEAIGFFSDDDIVQMENGNIPDHLLSSVSAGDIMYKDQNGDGVIDSYDSVALGCSSSIPALSYGLQLGAKYKGLSVDLQFQGVGEYTRMLTASSVYQPLYSNNNISYWYINDQVAWTPETAETATVPRLSTLYSYNNSVNSTVWMVDGSFFKLRNMNISYTLPTDWTQSAGIRNCQVYLRGNNLFSFDSVPYFNCEDFSTDYVDLSEWYVGVKFNF